MRVVFVSPHPDDVEFFAGGTLLHHVAAGDAVTVLMLSHGEDGTLRPGHKGPPIATVRTAEAEARYQALPGVTLRWLDFTDGAIRHSPEAVTTLTEALTALHPELVYAPECELTSTLFAHPDHLHAGRLVIDALKAAGLGVTVRHYHSARATVWVAIDAHHADADRAIGFYRSQFSPLASPPFLLAWGRLLRAVALRWWGHRAGTRRAEGFREAP